MRKRLFTEQNRKIKIIRYPDDSILHSITKRHGKSAEQVRKGLINVISDAHYHSDFFCVIMYNDVDEIIGCANYIQSSSEPLKWLYTDLWTEPEYRRQGCAAEIVDAGCRYLSELNAKTLLCMVEPHNEASLNLQKYLGFEQIAVRPFEDFDVNGMVMFKMNISMNFNIVSLADDFNHLGFICELLTHPANISALHLKKISDNKHPQFYKETREALIFCGEEERNYIIRKGVVPVGWFKLKGLSGGGLRIGMLIVHEKYRNLGAGTSALKFVEEFALSIQCRHVYTNITSDNFIAQTFYKKAGYIAEKENVQQNEDKTETVRITLHKEIFFD